MLFDTLFTFHVAIGVKSNIVGPQNRSTEHGDREIIIKYHFKG